MCHPSGKDRRLFVCVVLHIFLGGCSEADLMTQFENGIKPLFLASSSWIVFCSSLPLFFISSVSFPSCLLFVPSSLLLHLFRIFSVLLFSPLCRPPHPPPLSPCSPPPTAVHRRCTRGQGFQCMRPSYQLSALKCFSQPLYLTAHQKWHNHRSPNIGGCKNGS